MKPNKILTSSYQYWAERYINTNFKNSSGNGRLKFRLRYKAKMLNKIFETYTITKIADFGCGDGLLASRLKCAKYYGIEINSEIVSNLKNKFFEKKEFEFSTKFESRWRNKIDASISVDVIFHLVEKDVYQKYMNELFSTDAKYVIIRAYNHESQGTGRNSHILHREFLNTVKKYFPNYNLINESPPRRRHIYLSDSDKNQFFVFKKSQQ